MKPLNYDNLYDMCREIHKAHYKQGYFGGFTLEEALVLATYRKANGKGMATLAHRTLTSSIEFVSIQAIDKAWEEMGGLIDKVAERIMYEYATDSGDYSDGVMDEEEAYEEAIRSIVLERAEKQ